MTNPIQVDICVIGGGSAGLSVAAGAQKMGAMCALVEAGKMGGDCLNYGCVPSKSLLSAAKTANRFRTANQFGIESKKPEIDITKVLKQVQGVIATIAPHDSVERFEKLGVKIIKGFGQFQNKTTLMVGEQAIKARYFVIATGSSPTIPSISGIENVPFYTNETIFNLAQNPEHLIIIGGGPIGCEMAQAFLLLGIKVTVLEVFKILPHDEPELVDILRQHLIGQGLNLLEEVKVRSVQKQNTDKILVEIEHKGKLQSIEGSHLLVATGRKPNLEKLNLSAAGVNFSAKGVKVDKRLRSTNKRIYAIGDAVGGYQFTHIANYHAGIAIRNMLFKLPAKVDYSAVPWVTYTLPELAHVGLSTADALKKYPKAKILNSSLSENDRAQAEHETLGKIQVTVSPKGDILGATILSAHAGELLLPWILAIQNQQNIRKMANAIIPYPTFSEIAKSIVSEFYTPILFSPKIKFLLKFLKFFG